ncbi:unnamed protein product [Phytophthora fragariaefolia]|uniref:Unnamed protein product n=1 Tax=Phytophthora fragariaefolia TaxID=1490495 RepID=A0A9W7CZR1_9STRA|nr:unnamed protein product [Phytophthora fragariaefolia]
MDERHTPTIGSDQALPADPGQQCRANVSPPITPHFSGSVLTLQNWERQIDRLREEAQHRPRAVPFTPPVPSRGTRLTLSGNGRKSVTAPIEDALCVLIKNERRLEHTITFDSIIDMATKFMPIEIGSVTGYEVPLLAYTVVAGGSFNNKTKCRVRGKINSVYFWDGGGGHPSSCEPLKSKSIPDWLKGVWLPTFIQSGNDNGAHG